MKKSVRILLVGDGGVGKTSLILTLLSDVFPEQDIPLRSAEVTIPGDVNPLGVPTHIVDYNAEEQDEDCLIDELVSADVVCIVYDVMNLETVQSISSYWMPIVRRSIQTGRNHGSEEYTVKKPVVLVGNKADDLIESNVETMSDIMNDWSEIESCIECSARAMKNITEVFYYAQKAVLHPTAPLYIPERRCLSDRAKQALTRIFRICDEDNDGLLMHSDLNLFQKRCFGVPLPTRSLNDVLSIVKRHINDGVIGSGLTLAGFLFLHNLFIQRGRHETTWTVLRKFGYDDQVDISKDYTHPSLPSTRAKAELTATAVHFLLELVNKYDADGDGCLSPTELHAFTSTTCHLPPPWNSEVAVDMNAQGWISTRGILAHVALAIRDDPIRTIEWLAYMGFPYVEDCPLLDSVHWPSSRRTTFVCDVAGPRGVGKTCFIQALLGRTLNYTIASNIPSQKPSVAITSVNVTGTNDNIWLILKEVGEERPTTQKADAVAILYDVTNARSFEQCARLYDDYASVGVPALLIAAKSDQNQVLQDSAQQPLDFCVSRRLPQPAPFTCVQTITSHTYSKVAAVCVGCLNEISSSPPPGNAAALLTGVAVGVSAAAIIGLVLHKVWQSPKPRTLARF